MDRNDKVINSHNMNSEAFYVKHFSDSRCIDRNRWWNVEVLMCWGQFSCLSFINHVITNAYYVIISFCFLFPSSYFFLISGLFQRWILAWALATNFFGQWTIFAVVRCVFGCKHNHNHEAKGSSKVQANYYKTFDMWNISFFYATHKRLQIPIN